MSLVGLASAHGGFGGFHDATPEEQAQHQQEMFEEKAEFLGITVEEVKDVWVENKSFKDLAEENGISEEELKTHMQEQHKVRAQERMQNLVTEGIITQDQADQRLATMRERMESGELHRGGKGFHCGFGK